MLVGELPFYDKNIDQMKKNIQENDLIFPENVSLSEDVKDFISKVRFIQIFLSQY